MSLSQCAWQMLARVGRCVAVCCSVLQCVAMCCSVLQCVATYCRKHKCAWQMEARVNLFVVTH